MHFSLAAMASKENLVLTRKLAKILMLVLEMGPASRNM